MKSKIQIRTFLTNAGWRWQMKRSGRIIAESGGDGYKNKRDMIKTVVGILDSVAAGRFTFVK